MKTPPSCAVPVWFQKVPNVGGHGGALAHTGFGTGLEPRFQTRAEAFRGCGTATGKAPHMRATRDLYARVNRLSARGYPDTRNAIERATQRDGRAHPVGRTKAARWFPGPAPEGDRGE